MANFKTLMIEIMLKIKMLFEFLFKIEIKKVLIPALLFACLSSCSPTQRVNRIVERYNLSIKDTTIIKADTLETVLARSVFYQDTVFFYVTEKETQKIYVKGDTVSITTIVPEKKIVTERINVQPAKKNKTAVWLATIFGISFFLLFGLLIYIVIQLKITFKWVKR